MFVDNLNHKHAWWLETLLHQQGQKHLLLVQRSNKYLVAVLLQNEAAQDSVRSLQLSSSCKKEKL